MLHSTTQSSTTASCLHCWFTGLNEKVILMQYYTSMEMYANKCTENQVCNDCTYRQNRVFEVLSEDVRLSKYFHFKVLNTFQNNMSRIFRVVLDIVSFHARKFAQHFKNIFGLKQKCFFFHPSKFQLSCQRTDLLRQTFQFPQKNVKVSKIFDFANVIYTTNKNELKNNVVKQKHLSIGFFSPSEMESYGVTSTKSIPCLGGKRIMDCTQLHSSITQLV